jgi:hypothetical protein
MLLSLLTPLVLADEPIPASSDTTLSASPLSASPLSASDDLEEEEGESSGGRSRSSSLASGTVREIQRGFFGKSNVGGIGYLPVSGVGLGGTTHAGTLVGLSLGQDFVDQEKMSMAWELGVLQGLNGGEEYFVQSSVGCGAMACTEGDLRSYSVEVSYEFSYYPVRRIGLGVKVGGGILYSPLLMFSTSYAEEVLPDYGGIDYGYHNAVHPFGGGGLTFEYYTKLSHFSVGGEGGVFYGVGWGMGWTGSGYLKYTFGRQSKESRED